MATTHSTKAPVAAAIPPGSGSASREEMEKAHEEAKESEERVKKEGPPKTQGQIDAERAAEGGEVPWDEQGKPNSARRWSALERERQDRADIEKFRAELSRKHAERDREVAERENKAKK